MTTEKQDIWVGDVPPANPKLREIWISTALADVRFPSHPGQTYFTADTGASIAQQEPNVWLYRNKLYMLTSGQQLFVADSPVGPWTYKGFVYGNGTGGEAGFAAHAGFYIENEILYLFYCTLGANYKCASVPLSVLASNTPSVGWTNLGNILPNAAGLPTLYAANSWGNSCVFKIGAEYRMLVEALYTGESYLAILCTSQSILGPWKVDSYPIRTLNPNLIRMLNPDNQNVSSPAGVGPEGYNFLASSGTCIYENDKLVMIWHGGAISAGEGGVRSETYRSFSYDGGYTWETDNGGYPVYKRIHHTYEIDQVADPCCVNINGTWWAYWTCASNTDNRFVIRGAPLSPTMKIWNGITWDVVDQQGGSSTWRGLIYKTRYAIGGGSYVEPFGEYPVDPGATAGFSFVLPVASQENEVRVHNITTGVGTIAVTARAGDTMLGTNAAIAVGQTVTFYCRKAGYWCRAA